MTWLMVTDSLIDLAYGQTSELTGMVSPEIQLPVSSNAQPAVPRRFVSRLSLLCSSCLDGPQHLVVSGTLPLIMGILIFVSLTNSP